VGGRCGRSWATSRADVLAAGPPRENFGTWRDAEGTAVWGVNDFDEVVRCVHTPGALATSALLRQYHDLRIDGKRRERDSRRLPGGLEKGGHAFVSRSIIRRCARWRLYRLHDQRPSGTSSSRSHVTPCPGKRAGLAPTRPPEGDVKVRIVHRVAGPGAWGANGSSRSRVRVGASRGKRRHSPLAGRIHYDTILRRGVRCPDPCVRVDGAWLVRRLRPDCSRVKLNELPRSARKHIVCIPWVGTQLAPSGARLPRHPSGLEAGATSTGSTTPLVGWRTHRRRTAPLAEGQSCRSGPLALRVIFFTVLIDSSVRDRDPICRCMLKFGAQGIATAPSCSLSPHAVLATALLGRLSDRIAADPSCSRRW